MSVVLCSVKSCPNKMIAKGICAAHRRRLLVHGSLQRNKPINKRNFGVIVTKYSEYRIWANMRYRCNNKNSKEYRHYGGRGIKVCKRWDDFWLFMEDMGPRPGKEFSIDRINNNGNYSPSNCRWATIHQQLKNRRPRKFWNFSK